MMFVMGLGMTIINSAVMTAGDASTIATNDSTHVYFDGSIISTAAKMWR